MKRILEIRASTVFQESRPHLKILGVRKVTNNIPHTEGPQIVGVTIKKFGRLSDQGSMICATLPYTETSLEMSK